MWRRLEALLAALGLCLACAITTACDSPGCPKGTTLQGKYCVSLDAVSGDGGYSGSSETNGNAGTGGYGRTATGGGGGPSMSCPGGQRECNGECISSSDCCGNAECPEGRTCVGHVCVCNQGTRSCDGVCVAGDGCCADQDCPTGGQCKDRACSCPQAMHRCGNRCVSDTVVDSCGSTCEPCKAPSGGSVDCVAGQCAPKCPVGQRPCAGVCIADSASCTGTCPDGSHDCSGVCLSNSSLNGCGASCTPCPAPASNGTATCDGAKCGIACNTGYKLCGDRCIALSSCCTMADCPSGAACSQTGACACPAGQKVCGASCILSSGCCDSGECGQGASCSGAHTCTCNSGYKTCNGACLSSSQCCADGDCPTNYKCQSNACACVPQCSNKTCGSDGCNGVCAPNRCSSLQTCTDGNCVNTQVCGNAIREGTEECDDGNLDDGDDCLGSCRKAKCGDGVVHGHGGVPEFEQCDPGDPTWAPVCNSSCRLTSYGFCASCALSSCPSNVTDTCSPHCTFDSSGCPSVGAPWSQVCLGAACYIACRNGECPFGLSCAPQQGAITPTGMVKVDVCVVTVPPPPN
jgi:hypothetical protein